MKIGFVGLGLMSGSLSIALKERYQDHYFIGLDHNTLHCEEALKRHLVDEIVDDISEMLDCDLIFLGIPVDGIISVLQNIESLHPECTIIDLGSTKELISQSIPPHIRQNVVTAHPMTGTEKFGPSAAIPNLYKDKVVVLCDLEKSGQTQQALAKSIFTDIGMKLIFMDSKEHDRHAAYISHMPHALSYSLANAVMKQADNQSIVSLAGGGFKDMSRIAKSSPNMWEDVFRQNKGNILEAIHVLQSELKKCEKMLNNEEWEALHSWMAQANTLHDI